MTAGLQIFQTDSCRYLFKGYLGLHVSPERTVVTEQVWTSTSGTALPIAMPRPALCSNGKSLPPSPIAITACTATGLLHFLFVT